MTKGVVLRKDGSTLVGIATWAYPVDEPPLLYVPALDERLYASVWQSRGWTIDWMDGTVES